MPTSGTSGTSGTSESRPDLNTKKNFLCPYLYKKRTNASFEVKVLQENCLSNSWPIGTFLLGTRSKSGSVIIFSQNPSLYMLHKLSPQQYEVIPP